MELGVIIIIFIIISIVIAFGIGANDETFSVIHGARVLSMRYILIIAVILAVLGALILGEGVSETVGKETLNIELNYAIVATILLSTAIWLIISSSLGLPISTTHATIGAIIGMGLFLGGNDGLNWGTIISMSIWWILSPVFGFVATYVAYKILLVYKEKTLNGFQDYERSERIFSYLILITICITAFSRAGNDCSNAVGIVVGMGDIEVNLLLLITGISFAGGLVVLGRIVIKNLGGLTELRPSTAFAAQVPTAIILFIGTLQGIPLSGSHMLVASLVGLSKASRTPMKGGIWKIIIIWLVTFPAAAILSIVLYLPVSLFL